MELHSQDIGKIALALSKAQGEMPNATHDQVNPFVEKQNGKGGYSSMASVVKAIKEALSKNEISYSQPTIEIGGNLYICTMLMHSSGQWVRGIYPVIAKNINDPQNMKAGYTYAKRCGLLALTGVAEADDDDGNEASGKTVTQQPEQNAEPAKSEQKRGALAKTNSKQITTPKKTESNTGHLNSPIDSASFIWAWGPKKGTPLSSFSNDELNSAINWLNSWDKSTPLQQKAIEHIENILGS